MANLAKYIVQLEAQTSRYVAELEKANRSLDKFHKNQTSALDAVKKGFAALGIVLSVRAFANFIKGSIDAADRARDMSIRLGVAAQTLQALELAAKMGGAGLGNLEVGLRQLSRAISGAASEGGQAAALFTGMGVAVKTADGQLRSTEAVLRDVADAFSRMSDGADKAALAQRLFGRSGATLIPVLNDGAAGLDRMIERAERLGIIWSDEALKAADEFNDTVVLMGALVDGFGATIARTALPAMQAIASAMLTFGENAETGRRLGEGFGTAIKLIAHAVIGLGYGMVGLGEKMGATFAVMATLLENRNLLDLPQGIREAGAILSELALDQARLQAEMQKALDAVWGSADDGGEALAALAGAQRGAGDATGATTAAIDEQIKALEASIGKLRLNNTEWTIWQAQQKGASESQIAAMRHLLALGEVFQKEHDLKEEVKKLVEELNVQAKTFGLTGDAAELMKLKLKGMNDEQIAAVAAAMNVVKALEEQHAAQVRLSMASLPNPLNPVTGKSIDTDAATAERLAVPDTAAWEAAQLQMTEIQRENEDARFMRATEMMQAELAMQQEMLMLSSELRSGSGVVILENLQSAFEERISLEQQLTERVSEEERRRLEMRLATVNESISIARSAAEIEIGMRQGVMNASIGFLNALGNEHRGAAMAALALQKFLTIKQIFFSGQAEARAASAWATIFGGPIAGAAAFARVMLGTKIQMGLVAATGLIEAAQLSSGGTQATLGTTANPINVSGATSAATSGSATRASQRVTQIIFQGDMIGWDEHIRTRVIDGIRDAVRDRDVVLIEGNTRQAAVLARP